MVIRAVLSSILSKLLVILILYFSYIMPSNIIVHYSIIIYNTTNFISGIIILIIWGILSSTYKYKPNKIRRIALKHKELTSKTRSIRRLNLLFAISVMIFSILILNNYYTAGCLLFLNIAIKLGHYIVIRILDKR